MTARRQRPARRALAIVAALASGLTTMTVASVIPTSAAAADPRPDAKAFLRQATQPAPLAPAGRPEALRGGQRSALATSVRGVVADGAVAMTVRAERDRFALGAADGLRQWGERPPAGRNSPFRVASNTKMMVATLAMQLVEDGTWSLDTTVEDVWPGLIPGRGDEVTIENLLQHSSGIPDGIFPVVTANTNGPTMADAIEALEADYEPEQVLEAALAQPWTFEPGTQAVYSNTGYIVLGMLLERASGAPLAHLLRDNVFRPAGMTGTAYLTETGLPKPALVDTITADGQTYDLDGFDPELFAAAGAVMSTTTDLNAFTEALATGRLVKPATFERMRRTRPVQVTVDAQGSPVRVDYGLGVYRMPDPCEPGQFLWGHDGATFGTLSYAVTSLDGTRQVSAGWTGREYNTDGSVSYNPMEAIDAALSATCGRG